jgi:hypothetical protein
MEDRTTVTVHNGDVQRLSGRRWRGGLAAVGNVLCRGEVLTPRSVSGGCKRKREQQRARRPNCRFHRRPFWSNRISMFALKHNEPPFLRLYGAATTLSP